MKLYRLMIQTKIDFAQKGGGSFIDIEEIRNLRSTAVTSILAIDIDKASNDSGNLRQGSRIHCLEKCCFLKDVNNSAYCSEIWPTN